MSFGFGKVICPLCYNGEKDFVFPDNRYFLNRLISRLNRNKTKEKRDELLEDLLFENFHYYEDNEIAHSFA
jgi:hypothetical protein